jgi:hypothetical protein
MAHRSNKGSKWLSASGIAGGIWTAIVNAVLAVDAENADELLRTLKDDQAKLAAIARIVVGGEKTIETVTVPDLPSAALAADTRKRAGLTHVNPAYGSWDFARDRCGKTYEVARWRPGRRVSSDEVRRHFRAEGGERPFLGNPAAFCALVGKDMPDGWCVTVPDDADCFRDVVGSLYAPCSYRNGAYRELHLRAVAGGWDDGYCFFAFREVPR